MNKTYMWYLAELLLLFIGIPLIFYFELLPIPKLVALVMVAIGCILVLKFDSSYDLWTMFTWPGGRSPWIPIILKTTAVFIVIFLLVMVYQPDSLFSMPKEEPRVWALILLMYPLLSVIPQELIYRVYFFHRYKKIINGEGQLVWLSAFSFSFLHIVYDNWWAAALSFAGGLIFAQTYIRSRSLLWVSLEHVIYGYLIFTIGMGDYFYESM